MTPEELKKAIEDQPYDCPFCKSHTQDWQGSIYESLGIEHLDVFILMETLQCNVCKAKWIITYNGMTDAERLKS